MNLAERKKKFRQTGYWCSLEISGIGFVAVFTFLLLLMYLEVGSPFCCVHPGVGVDLAATPHAVKLPSALRENAILIAVMRDGSVYLDRDKLVPHQIPPRIMEKVSKGSERKVYIKADGRAKYGNVVDVIEAVRDAGIEQIGFITSRPQDRVEP